MPAWALGLLLSLPAGAHEGGPGNAPPQQKLKTAERDAKTEDERQQVQPYADSLDPKVGRKFWSDWGGFTPEDRRQVGHLVSAFKRGPGDFGQALLEMDPRTVSGWLKRLEPFLMESGGRGGRRDRPYRGPPPEVWEQLSRQHPEQPEGHSGLGRSRFDAGDFAGAAESYDRALALGDRTSDTLLGRGLAAERAGDFELANRDAAEALSLDPENPNAAALYQLTRGRVSAIRLGLASPPRAQPPSDDDAPALEGTTAVPEAPGGERQPPPQQSARWAREAARRLEMGDPARAEEAATRAIALDGGNIEALNLRAMAREKRGDREGAVKDANLALKFIPGNVPLLNTRSWAFSGLRRFDEALGDSALAVARAPGHAYSRATLARAQGGLGRRAEMLESLREAARLDARFQPTLDAALQLPPDGDTELLFRGDLAAKAPSPGPGKNSRFLVLLLATLSGGGLVAIGLLHILSPATRERITTTLRRRNAGASAREEPPSGKFWERYEYRRVVASGGMGIVYEARDKSLDRRVAAKKMRGEIRDNPKDREAFIKEARLCAGLKHPGIVEIYAIEEHGPDLYLVFEFVDGRTLRQLARDRGRIPLKDAVPLFREVCDAVDYAHEKGVIHRDLKPANIMVLPGGRTKVMDFGIARRAEEPKRVLLTTTIAGTPAYMAPELDQGLLCRESDVFSLGVCLYEVLTGRLPYEGQLGALALAKLEGKFKPATRSAPGLPAAVDALLARALAPAPAHRFKTAKLFQQALEKSLT